MKVFESWMHSLTTELEEIAAISENHGELLLILENVDCFLPLPLSIFLSFEDKNQEEEWHITHHKKLRYVV